MVMIAKHKRSFSLAVCTWVFPCLFSSSRAGATAAVVLVVIALIAVVSLCSTTGSFLYSSLAATNNLLLPAKVGEQVHSFVDSAGLSPTSSANRLRSNEYLAIKKFSGDGWELWDRKSVLFQDLNTTSCRWVTFKGHQEVYQQTLVPPGGLEIPMCVHAGKESVSGVIARIQKWPDCEKLLLWWREENTNNNVVTPGIHLEIGANIGSCLLDVLLGTKATIVAFEPNPTNLFILTSTLALLDKSYRDRVFLFPVGLGNKSERNNIFMAVGNAGNSVVGRIVKDFKRQRFAQPLPIFIERLDDILDAEHTRVNVMKLDAQGYECFILDGMPQVMSKVRRVGFEFADKWQSAFPNCSGKVLVDRLRGHEMLIYRSNGSLVEGDIVVKGFEDFFALRSN